MGPPPFDSECRFGKDNLRVGSAFCIDPLNADTPLNSGRKIWPQLFGHTGFRHFPAFSGTPSWRHLRAFFGSARRHFSDILGSFSGTSLHLLALSSIFRRGRFCVLLCTCPHWGGGGQLCGQIFGAKFASPICSKSCSCFMQVLGRLRDGCQKLPH